MAPLGLGDCELSEERTCRRPLAPQRSQSAKVVHFALPLAGLSISDLVARFVVLSISLSLTLLGSQLERRLTSENDTITRSLPIRLR